MNRDIFFRHKCSLKARILDSVQPLSLILGSYANPQLSLLKTDDISNRAKLLLNGLNPSTDSFLPQSCLQRGVHRIYWLLDVLLVSLVTQLTSIAAKMKAGNEPKDPTERALQRMLNTVDSLVPTSKGSYLQLNFQGEMFKSANGSGEIMMNGRRDRMLQGNGKTSQMIDTDLQELISSHPDPRRKSRCFEV